MILGVVIIESKVSKKARKDPGWCWGSEFILGGEDFTLSGITLAGRLIRKRGCQFSGIGIQIMQ